MTIKEHIVFFSVSGWGHTRALIAFAYRIVQQKPDVGITIFSSGNIIDKTEIELTRYFAAGDVSKNNIRQKIPTHSSFILTPLELAYTPISRYLGGKVSPVLAQERFTNRGLNLRSWYQM
ncbi:glycosyltransferase family 1 protein [Sphaerobolus stellatus SS14]|uniref:Glycosyltransferase family 1 protein n=1 Tax=Sphaerobolus stellatus (strain SS14) TaxID=990650 RepID=A0A0C9W4K8_SPHS4|nr:glycosyltransferase family 1 protein [Sphaerobolus stellatus SS14]